MVRTTRSLLAAVAATLLASTSGAAAARAADLPDPLATGPYAINSDPGYQYKLGTVNLQEPNTAGGAATGNSSSATLQVRGSLTYPTDRSTPAPLIVLVHGNHGSCRQGDGGAISDNGRGTKTTCTTFERNDLGYQYLATNLASWGYVVASIDQDELIYYQDGNGGKGMHQRRLLIAATLDGLYDANAGPIAADADHNLGSMLVGKIDFSRIGLMGHSRGGDATTSFLDFNRTRPAPGRRYDIRASIAVAPVDYERRAPYGTNFLTILPACDGDVSNLQGARFYERGQYISPGDPFPKVQEYLLGADHNYFNSVWSADNDDSTAVDDACGPNQDNASTSIRLSGGTTIGASLAGGLSRMSLLGTYSRSNTGPSTTTPATTAFYPTQANTWLSGDPSLMGDQEKAGLAEMSEFFRRYVGGELAFQPYVTGELNAVGDGANLPASACPTSPSGTRIPCQQRLQTDYFAPAGEREDVITPNPDNPLTVSAVGTALSTSGFANPFTDDGGVTPKPATTDTGADWCNPEPTEFYPGGQTQQTGYPRATKPCPLPNVNAVGGQASNRENSPVNQSYGLQLSLAWDHPATPATVATRIPEADGDVSHLKSLALGAAVNYFDSRNPPRTGGATWNPALAAQNFEIQLTDAAGHVATVAAGERRYGTALQQSTGSANARLHIILNQVRVPLTDFSAQGLDLTSVRKVALLFGGSGMPATGSVQIADVRFQEAQEAAPDADPATIIAATPRYPASPATPDVVVLKTAAAAAKSATTCSDTATPAARLASLRLEGGRLSLTGSASDKGCAATATKAARKGQVRSVQVKITQATATARLCRFVTTKGTLTAPKACASRIALVAHGTSRWSLKLGRKLGKGRYAISVSVIDTAGNVATTSARRLTVG